jgi:hypothetical protein
LQFRAAGEGMVHRTNSQTLAHPHLLGFMFKYLDIQPAGKKLRVTGYVSREVEQLFAGPGQCPGNGITFHVGLCVSAGGCCRVHDSVLTNVNVTLDQECIMAVAIGMCGTHGKP